MILIKIFFNFCHEIHAEGLHILIYKELEAYDSSVELQFSRIHGVLSLVGLDFIMLGNGSRV